MDGFPSGQGTRAALSDLALDPSSLQNNYDNLNDISTVQFPPVTGLDPSLSSSMAFSSLFGHADSGPASPLIQSLANTSLPTVSAGLAGQFDFGSTQPAVLQTTKILEDLTAFPFDLHTGSLPSDVNQLGGFLASKPLESMLPPSNTTVAMALLGSDPIAMDGKLQSPLGLEDSPFSEFFASPMFEDDSGTEAPPLDYPSLFPAPVTSVDFNKKSTMVSPALTAMSGLGPALPSPAFSIANLPNSSSSTPFVSPAFAPVHLESAPTPASSGPSRGKAATGFRGASTPLVPLDAPIQPRQYAVPSSTSRKRKTVAVERELAKRGRPSLSKAAETPVAAAAEDIPSDLVAAVERKRLQNTLSARKSRARKQERLAELETENEALKARVKELEAMLGFK